MGVVCGLLLQRHPACPSLDVQHGLHSLMADKLELYPVVIRLKTLSAKLHTDMLVTVLSRAPNPASRPLSSLA